MKKSLSVWVGKSESCKRPNFFLNFVDKLADRNFVMIYSSLSKSIRKLDVINKMLSLSPIYHSESQENILQK